MLHTQHNETSYKTRILNGLTEQKQVNGLLWFAFEIGRLFSLASCRADITMKPQMVLMNQRCSDVLHGDSLVNLYKIDARTEETKSFTAGERWYSWWCHIDVHNFVYSTVMCFQTYSCSEKTGLSHNLFDLFKHNTNTRKYHIWPHTIYGNFRYNIFCLWNRNWQ